MKKFGGILCGVLCFVVFAVGGVGAGETAGRNSEDHALVPSLQGLTVKNYDVKDMDAYVLPCGRLIQRQAGKVLNLEGKITRILYKASINKSTYEIYKYYEQTLKNNGFTVLFSGNGQELENWVGVFYNDNYCLQGKDTMQRYICGKLSQPSGDTYVAMYSSLGWDPFANTEVDIIEIPKEGIKQTQEKAIIPSPLTPSDSGIEQNLKKNGKAIVLGVEFKEASDEMKSGSEAALNEIAAIVRRNPGMRFVVVCYTDSNGTAEYCQNLSARRAEKLLRFLMLNGADKTCLTAKGAGWVPADSRGLSMGEKACGNQIVLEVEK